MGALGHLLNHIHFEPMSGCWLWAGSWDRDGYGRAKQGGKVVRAHQAVWNILRGGIRRGRVLDHLCNNRACCNPDHLEPVSQACNCRRREVRALSVRSCLGSGTINHKPDAA